MLILGIDTSGKQGSVALLRAEGNELCPLDVAMVDGRQCVERLLPTIAELLERHGETRKSIGLIAVASGPGSFTGLRVAVATVKGLSEAFGTPVVAVSVLEAMALNTQERNPAERDLVKRKSNGLGRVDVAIDAQRSEVFWGGYRFEPESAEPVSANEGICGFAEFVSRRAEGGSLAEEALRTEGASTTEEGASTTSGAGIIVTPDVELARRLNEAGVKAELMARPAADDFARIAYRRYLAGERAEVATLDANYLRRSDAEMLAAMKAGAATETPGMDTSGTDTSGITETSGTSSGAADSGVARL